MSRLVYLVSDRYGYSLSVAEVLKETPQKFKIGKATSLISDGYFSSWVWKTDAFETLEEVVDHLKPRFIGAINGHLKSIEKLESQSIQLEKLLEAKFQPEDDKEDV